MGITTMGFLWAAAFFAAAPTNDAPRLDDYGGKYKCSDAAVKAQVLRTLSSAAVPYEANAIQAAPGKLAYDAKGVAIAVGKPTAIVTQPGAAGRPTGVKLARSGAGAAVDGLMCRYRRTAGKTWSQVGLADLLPDGHLAKRMPADVRGFGRAFALHENPGESEDSVVVLVAAGVDGKAAGFEVSVASQGLHKRKHDGAAKGGGKDLGKRILAEAADPKWQRYTYGEHVLFPEAAGEVDGYDDKAFDCSYFVWLVYHHVGIDYDFTGTEGLSKLGSGQFVQVTTPRPGDLVVWREELGSNVKGGHVGIVIDDETFYDNSGSSSVGISHFSAKSYQMPRLYLRRKGL
ncbi:MAG: C40 family peptidase [Deltaproteobacteria bacterium]|nr:C40 family peptidase [Deltaproteobacteria bacterium]